MKPYTKILLALSFITALHTTMAQPSEWEPVNRGLKHLLVYTIEVDPVDPLVMYCGTEYGNLYKTTDGGYNWVLSRNGIPEGINAARMSALFLDRKHHNIIYAGYSHGSASNNLFRSTDYGATWSGFDLPANWGGILTFHKTSGDPERLICGQGVSSGLFVSSNDGATWTHILDRLGVQAIASHEGNTNVVFCGTSQGNGERDPLYKTTNGGSSWSSIPQASFPEGYSAIRALQFAPQNKDHIYAGVTGSKKGLYVSTDLGGSWKKLNSEREISEIAIHPQNEDIIYISTVHEGVFRTTDGGITWDNYSLGLPDDPIMRVRIAPGYPVRVFAVTLRHGIFRLVDEELPPQ